ncbi:hypothetical protein Aperf_G00000039147 [Anoplocephala perfoliata]
MGSGRVLQQLLRSCSTNSHRTRTRFAPSPTGPLHIGGLRTALINYMVARKDGGDFILRIEDTDHTRCFADATKGIIDNLGWVGLIPDEGPTFGGQFGPYIQSQRTELYRKYADHLLQTGWAYRCFCSHERLELLKNEQRRRGETVRYDNRCRHLSSKKLQSNLSQNIPYVLRFKMKPDNIVFTDTVFGEINFQNPDSEGDPVIMKSDGLPVYHFANVIDDHLMEISQVIRGSEWITSVPKHIQLYAAFEWHPPTFAHLPLMLASSGRKFSKRDKEHAAIALVENLRREGHLPSALLTWLAATGGLFDFAPSTANVSSKEGEFKALWKPSKRIEELIPSFEIHSLNRHHARVDPELLRICGRAHFDRLIDETSSGKHPNIADYLRNHSNTFHDMRGEHVKIEEILNDEERFLQILFRLRGRISTLSDLTSASSEISFFWQSPKSEVIKTSLCGFNDICRSFSAVASKLESLEEPSEDQVKTILESSNTLSGLPKSKFFKKLRVCLTGCEHGMPIHELILLLTPKEAAARIRQAVHICS